MRHLFDLFIEYWMWWPFVGAPTLATAAAIARAFGKDAAADCLIRDAEIIASGAGHQVSS